MRRLARLATLRDEIILRLGNPRLQPPAWQHFLLVVYEHFPPPSLDAEQRAAEVRRIRSVEAMSAGVLRALRQALIVFHPDRNRAEARGAEWASVAEEISKMATELIEQYKGRVQQPSSG